MLSDKHRVILALSVRGYTVKEISSVLDVKEATVFRIQSLKRHCIWCCDKIPCSKCDAFLKQTRITGSVGGLLRSQGLTMEHRRRIARLGGIAKARKRRKAA